MYKFQVKKIPIKIAVILCLLPSVSYAVDNTVKLGGALDFQSTYYRNDGAKTQKILSQNKRQFGFYSSVNAFLDYKLETENGLKYGTKIGIETTTKNDRSAPMAIYTENDLGRVEVGSDKSAGKKMKIVGYKASCATGNGWDARVKTSPDGDLLAYITNFCSFLDSKMRTSGKIDYSRKITYFTPKFSFGANNLQFGASYIPDSSNMGHSGITDEQRHTPVGASKFKFVIKDGISYGAKHKVDVSDDLFVETSVVNEVGKPIAFDKKTEKKSDIKFTKLNSYVVGSEVNYQETYSFSASYGNYNKSLTSPSVDKIGRTTYMYAVGGKYKFNDKKNAASINYFASDHKKSKLDAITLGFDYLPTSGVKSYLQCTYYKTKGKYLDDNKLRFDGSEGILVYIGAKLNI
ncbi:MAG: hypothetical protein HRU35_00130 [Rickettsiaceae bacterium]|nr:hypothetical protein [Rickettsiaceae bacterium]